MSLLTKSSRAIREEIDYGINSEGLPIIVVYPEYSEKSDIIDSQTGTIKKQITRLWDNLPIFRDSKSKVPTMHIPNKKALIKTALSDPDFMIATKGNATNYFYNC